MRKAALGACLGCLALAAVPSPAAATYHLMKIREYFTGNFGASFNDSYVELQMYAAGQNHVASRTLSVWDHTDVAPVATTTFSADVPNGQNQATILIGDTSISGSSDATNMALNLIQTQGGGAICWVDVDCISVGTGPAPGAAIPSPTGPAATFPFTGQAIRRTIARGCPTALDPADDTNNSEADFSVTNTPIPRNNAAPITEKLCPPGVGVGGNPNTKIKKRPRNRSDDDSPTFKFKSDEVNSTFKCKLDRKPFRKCRSPKTYHHLDPGKHKFKVKAIDADGNVDSTPAKDRFKVLP
jgi:hypothetical protein